VIYDLLRDDGISRHRIETRGEVPGIFHEIAMSQLDDTIAEIVCKRHVFGSLGPPPHRDLFGKSFAESATLLFQRLSSVQQQICNLEGPTWCAEFERSCEEERRTLLPKWEAEWISLCNGKRFFSDLHSRFGVKVSPIKLKVRIMERLARERADEWVLVESVLREALKP